MRKSLAPSFKSVNARPMGKPLENNVQNSCTGGSSETVRSAISILNLLKESTVSSGENDLLCQQTTGINYSANSPYNALPVSQCKRPLADAFDNVDEEECVRVLPSPNEMVTVKRKFNVVWGKLSKKKHKKWEGDGLAEIGPNSVILKDCDGKILGSTRGVKTDELEEGSRVIVGGKEIELIDLLLDGGKKEDSAAEGGNVPKPQMPAVVTRPSKKPKFMLSKTLTGSSDKNVDSLIMPTPPAEHQWLYNQEKLPLVDVIIDSYLSKVLRPHQKVGVQFLYECVCGMKNPFRHQMGSSATWEGCILADEMGLGKTLQCITLIWTLLRKGPYGNRPVFRNVLIITPSSLAANWMKEFQRWLGREKIKPFLVTQKNRPIEYMKSRNNQVMIISYEMVVRCLEDIKRIRFDAMICDEGHRLKNTIIKTTQALAQLNIKKKILLSGTPIQNDLQEFFSLVDFVNPGILGSSAEFRKHYESPIVASRQPHCSEEVVRLGETRAGELNSRTAWFILRRTQAVINQYLPKKVEAVIFCHPFPMQVKLYKSAISYWEMQTNKEEEPEKGVPHLSVLTVLKKICNHPKLITAFDAEEAGVVKHLQEELSDNDLFENTVEHSGKMWFVETLLHSLSHLKEKVILVSYYTQTLDIFADICDSRKYKYCRLDGSVPTAKRMAIVESFNNPYENNFVFLLSARAGGVGLNLTGASRLVLYDSDWNPASDLQAMARIWRDGQKRSVYIYRLLTTGTIEEKIYQRQINKTGLSGAVVDPKNPSGIKLSLAELKDLFTFHEDTLSLTHGLLDCKCLNADSNVKENLGPASVDNELDDDDERECQLGLAAKTSQTASLPISQLNNWKHLSPPFEVSELEDMGLSFLPTHITFIFQSTTE
ncbi:DNA repair and recombination protein RAD54B-like isoform X2 [Ischnura elegans]|uniref:DNA repair and recombination protein RAD54B-like isoform X2 n=1 Tax=Ischnura elegans TaxID=197161 RepID=UPI001ED89201|nr:DNA repair and recombination protein RAD54B-like isoform X2 [Ischnura elegans]